jgi:hypothetical protein
MSPHRLVHYIERLMLQVISARRRENKAGERRRELKAPGRPPVWARHLGEVQGLGFSGVGSTDHLVNQGK